jgi:hypothetical protein
VIGYLPETQGDTENFENACAIMGHTSCACGSMADGAVAVAISEDWTYRLRRRKFIEANVLQGWAQIQA